MFPHSVAEFIRESDTLRITGGMATAVPSIDCGAAATTLRLLLPAALALYGEANFTGAPSLMSRPLEPYFRLFRERGIEYELNDNCLRVRGRLLAGEYALPGDVSSQFFSGCCSRCRCWTASRGCAPKARYSRGRIST